MSWELIEKGIVSIGTNPGPVHSDRIYKTVYPKAASEFLRVSGFEDLSPSEVEAANNEIVGLLGEDDETIKAGIKSAAEKLGKPETTLTNLLDKVKSIAEKIQKNTSTMIPDQQFLSQEQAATASSMALCAMVGFICRAWPTLSARKPCGPFAPGWKALPLSSK